MLYYELYGIYVPPIFQPSPLLLGKNRCLWMDSKVLRMK